MKQELKLEWSGGREADGTSYKSIAPNGVVLEVVWVFDDYIYGLFKNGEKVTGSCQWFKSAIEAQLAAEAQYSELEEKGLI